VQESFLRLKFTSKRSIGSAPLKYSKENEKLNHRAEVKSQRKNVESI
jgi:hypothetical protein